MGRAFDGAMPVRLSVLPFSFAPVGPLMIRQVGSFGAPPTVVSEKGRRVWPYSIVVCPKVLMDQEGVMTGALPVGMISRPFRNVRLDETGEL